MITRYILKLVSFFLGVFLITDFLILIRVLFKNYGERLEYDNIKNTIIVFASLTILLFLIKIYLKNRINR